MVSKHMGGKGHPLIGKAVLLEEGQRGIILDVFPSNSTQVGDIALIQYFDAKLEELTPIWQDLRSLRSLIDDPMIMVGDSIEDLLAMIEGDDPPKLKVVPIKPRDQAE